MPPTLHEPRFQKPAPVDHPIHPLLQKRWSPRAFGPDLLPAADLHVLFEALRWAPSASNEQPWAFLVATRDDPANFEPLLACLNPGNQVWARQAPLLLVTVARRDLAAKPQPNRTALYDLGTSIAYLTFQATEMGLVVHQMAGLDLDKARAAGEVPEGYDAVTAVAVGYPAGPETLPDDVRKKDAAPRTRKPLRDFVFGSRWAVPAAWLQGKQA